MPYHFFPFGGHVCGSRSKRWPPSLSRPWARKRYLAFAVTALPPPWPQPCVYPGLATFFPSLYINALPPPSSHPELVRQVPSGNTNKSSIQFCTHSLLRMPKELPIQLEACGNAGGVVVGSAATRLLPSTRLSKNDEIGMRGRVVMWCPAIMVICFRTTAFYVCDRPIGKRCIFAHKCPISA